MPGILADHDRMLRLLGAKPEVIQKIDRLLVGAETPAEPTGPLTLTISGAARKSGFSRASLYRAIDTGALATVPGVNRRRIHRDDLEAFARGKKGGAE